MRTINHTDFLPNAKNDDKFWVLVETIRSNNHLYGNT
jgi:hypothetical protein